jgi:hypothetical protein
MNLKQLSCLEDIALAIMLIFLGYLFLAAALAIHGGNIPWPTP